MEYLQWAPKDSTLGLRGPLCHWLLTQIWPQAQYCAVPYLGQEGLVTILYPRER